MAGPSPSSLSFALDEERTHPWTLGEIAQLHPSRRPPSPPRHIKDIDRPKGSGWDESALPPASIHTGWNDDVRVPAPIDPVWSFDRQDYPAGWLKADSVAASMAFNATYDHALQWGHRFRRLNMFWHRPHEYNMQMYGRGARGDIAPDEVHAALDTILRARALSPPLASEELDLLHARLDITWLRHSRSPSRIGVALREFRIRDGRFTAEERFRLAQVVNDHCLVDFRDILICLDPRTTVVYGRTRDSEGISRRWMSLGSEGTPRAKPRIPDLEYEQRSEVSGSSGDELEDPTREPPYALSRAERAYQIHRHAGRDYERVLREIEDLKRWKVRLTEEAAEIKEEVDRRWKIRDELLAVRDSLRLEQKGSTAGSF